MATFNKRKITKPMRKRNESFSSEEESETEDIVSSALQETKELQHLRKRQRGVNIDDLLIGKSLKKEETKVDPLKLKTGGFVDLKTLKKEIANSPDEELEQIGTSFAAETNRRDEDADMLKYVEEELAKRKGHGNEEVELAEESKNELNALYELPDHIKQITSSNKKSEDMLSNQMLSGIPEIDLGIDAKIHNIEATEEAKSHLIQERRKKKDSDVSKFVPTNMAVNFMQHKRFNIEETKPVQKKEPPAPKPEPLRVGDVERIQTLQETKQKNPKEKATDDFHFEKFKRQLRKY